MKMNISEVATIIKRANKAVNKAIEQFKTENPGVDVEALLSEQKGLPPRFGELSNSEVNKFVANAKEQGVKMPFELMEKGILAAGRKDMQNGLAEILNAIELGKPNCMKCDEGMDNRGRSKKKL